MPTYEYACRDCGEHLEVVQSFKDDSLTVCPACQGSLRKVFSAAGIIFKGSGWHIKDYASSSSRGSASGGSSRSGDSGESGTSSSDGGKDAKRSKDSEGATSSSSSDQSSSSKDSKSSSSSSKGDQAASA